MLSQLSDSPTRSFTSLMEVYEQNYFLLRALQQKIRQHHAPGWDKLVLTGDDDMQLYITLLEESPYTVTWHFSYFFWEDEGETRIADPDLEVRLYYDARQAEALHCGTNQRCIFLRDFRTQIGSPLERKWQINQLLHKWLAYLISHDYQ